MVDDVYIMSYIVYVCTLLCVYIYIHIWIPYVYMLGFLLLEKVGVWVARFFQITRHFPRLLLFLIPLTLTTAVARALRCQAMTFLMDSANKQQQFHMKVFWRWVSPPQDVVKMGANKRYFLQALQKPTKVWLAIFFWSLRGVVSWMLGMQL